MCVCVCVCVCVHMCACDVCVCTYCMCAHMYNTCIHTQHVLCMYACVFLCDFVVA